MCMPKLLPMEADAFRAKGLYDLHLLLEGMPIGAIVRNDVTIDNCDGTLIRGANSTGKTCTIRSIGAAILFAQAGLPVCAESAEISLRDMLFCQFSSAEKDFDAMELVYPKEVPVFEKYDEYVPDELVRRSFAYGVLDMKTAGERIRSWKRFSGEQGTE